MNELTNRDKIDILLKEPSSKEISLVVHLARELQIPNVPLNLWTPEHRETANHDLGYAEKYLKMPCFEDNIGAEHGKRRIWVCSMAQKYPWAGKFLDYNALRWNCVGFMGILWELGRNYIGTRSRKVEEDAPRVMEIGQEDYHLLTTPEKLEFVEGVKDRTYDLMVFLSKQRPLKRKV